MEKITLEELAKIREEMQPELNLRVHGHDHPQKPSNEQSK